MKNATIVEYDGMENNLYQFKNINYSKIPYTNVLGYTNTGCVFLIVPKLVDIRDFADLIEGMFNTNSNFFNEVANCFGANPKTLNTIYFNFNSIGIQVQKTNSAKKDIVNFYFDSLKK